MIPCLVYAQGLSQFRDAYDTTIDKLMATDVVLTDVVVAESDALATVLVDDSYSYWMIRGGRDDGHKPHALDKHRSSQYILLSF